MKPITLFVAIAIACTFATCGCSGSRRGAPSAPAPPRPEVSTEVSVIPPQELKKGRPFVQFSGAVSQPEYPAANGDALVPSAGAFNSDMQ